MAKAARKESGGLQLHAAGAIEAVILALVFLVPVLIYTGTANANLIKVTTFNLGILVVFVLWLVEMIHSRKFEWTRSALHLPVACYLGWSLVTALPASDRSTGCCWWLSVAPL